ncbi:trifunctional purine biosynthetic protein adenosine-3 [Chelonus insularis]|uniref:trifunctional purine biosynthetic protein adenosine-3 n=1 Tax=Chelonus insularis TaxID=460826 RepID=UPI00158EAF3C|nr:trifunctional purine biosynthetic protein adenosine-3 [Chelonus insularis]XP_034945438.1 trifunctional purine biosynthetic protein adenosine-3 [Chelonus insularis]XP_034945440.1 trifunctional purine biosynthetic protein adenosine-3 [Chelonus insularis]XP_034945441.1 trifunctional purine biosynthetic protein adenosine-3 [Chelonus insularis]
MTIGATVLVIGGGGREHAICWKISQSLQVQKIYVSPGNSGIANVNKVQLVQLNVKDNKEVAEWSKKHKVNLVVVGPEEYLANGLADELCKYHIHCFGPRKLASQIEANKDWSKSFMDKHGIPTARWKAFKSAEKAKEFIIDSPFKALVIKATGLAAGKGVIVTANQQEACQTVDEMLINKKFGSASENIIIEELLEGEEVSVLAFTDGTNISMMPPAQDHKRIFDGDLGPNTGGMGAYSPCYLLDDIDYKKSEEIVEKTVKGLKQDGISYVGVLYVGLMITNSGLKVLEYNCRFGDPETQVILPLLNSDLYEIMKACCEGLLSSLTINWLANKFAVGVICASRGYPESASKGQVIKGIENIEVLKDHYIFHSGTGLSDQKELLTNGGRVLIATCLSSSLQEAAAKATIAAEKICFDGKQYRKDIAHKGIARTILKLGQLSYKNSGVDIEAGNSLVTKIKSLASLTMRSGVLGSIGSFGGLFDIKSASFKDSILVSGTDGVGTKLKIAIEYKKHNTIGIDLVAMCVNDILAHGAEPLFFLDYLACGHLNVEVAKEVIAGIVEGCKQAGCALIGGETAEMPDMYSYDDYDIAGFAVGAVERSDLLPKSSEIVSGDIVIGLPSSGIHSNGFSMVRKILKITGKNLNDIAPFSLYSKTIGEELLEPTKIYCRGVLPAFKSKLIKAFAHITGGGLLENIPRVLSNNCSITLNAENWKIPPVFGWLALYGGINETEMLKTFNCGIGAVIICAEKDKDKVMNLLHLEEPVIIGHVHEAIDQLTNSTVFVKNFTKSMEKIMKQHVSTLVENLSKPIKRVGVLISGSGTNLQALIDATRDPYQHIGAEIVIVISNKENAEGLAKAKKVGIPTKVIKHTDFQSREEFDTAVDTELIRFGVEIVCLAGFMRILSEKFVRKWKGSLLNIHPSLLPSFKGSNAHKDVLTAGVRVSGCTVHFVDVEIDSGAIIEQECVPVLPNDTIQTLQERVKNAEHRTFPKALQYLATGRIQLNADGTLQWNW